MWNFTVPNIYHTQHEAASERWLKYYESSEPSFKRTTRASCRLSKEQADKRFMLGFEDRPITNLWSSSVDFATILGYKKPVKSRNIFNSIIIDLLISAGTDKGVGYGRGSKYYKSACTGILGLSTVINAIDFLVEQGLAYDFHVPKGTHNKQSSFMYPTNRLLRRFGYVVSESSFSKVKSPHVVTLKNRKSKAYMDIPDEPFFSGAFHEVSSQNAFLDRLKIDFVGNVKNRRGPIIQYINHQGEPKTINLLHCSYTRKYLYCSSWNGSYYGGRYYGTFWQEMNSKDREHITINGEPVGTELDFRCIGLQIAYAKVGQKLVVDGYDISLKGIGIGTKQNRMFPFFSKKDERAFLKTVSHISLNATKPLKAKQAIRKYLKDEHGSIFKNFTDSEILEYSGKILSKFIDKHRCISEFFCSDFGVISQWLDSEIMTDIHKKCREQNIPILSIHDSVLYPVAKQNIVDDIRNRVLENHLSKFIETVDLRAAS